jgi:mitochondrial fission 1 protein
MGTTANTQKEAKKELDLKLSLSKPERQLLAELAMACAKEPSPSGSFQYAFALSKSSEPSELRYAVQILDGLVANGFEHQVDCMYGAATAMYLLGNFEEARVREYQSYLCLRFFCRFCRDFEMLECTRRSNDPALKPPPIFSPLFFHVQARCEAILRSQPHSRITKELHLAAIEAEEEKKRNELKTAALGGLTAAAAVGLLAGVVSIVLSSSRKR